MSKRDFTEFAKHFNFEPRQIEVTCYTGRTFVLRELDGSEQLVVDQTTKFENIEVFYKRVVAALVSIEGHQVPTMTHGDDFIALLKLIRGSELDELVARYSEEFLPKADKQKKGSVKTDESDE